MKLDGIFVFGAHYT